VQYAHQGYLEAKAGIGGVVVAGSVEKKGSAFASSERFLQVLLLEERNPYAASLLLEISRSAGEHRA
jgi:hypothetical protein